MQIEEDSFEGRRAKRQKTLKKRRRRRVIIALLLLLVAVGIVLCLTVFFPVKKVSASGSKLYSQEEITAAADLKEKNIFLIGEEKTLDKIRKKLPFIDSVKIKRRLPDSITLNVNDAKEYAYFVLGDKNFTVSKNWIVLEEYSEIPEGLLKIICNEPTLKKGSLVKYKSDTEKKVIDDLVNKLTEKSIDINEIDVSNIATISVRINGRFNVKFGTTAYLDKKIGHLCGMIESIGEGRQGDIDLSMWTPTKSEGSFIENK